MSLLYGRYCKLKLGSREIEYDKKNNDISIEFDQDFKAGEISITTLKIYNPSQETIKEATPKSSTNFTSVLVDAGYEDYHGTCVLGEVRAYKVTYNRPDRCLELKVTDSTAKWLATIIDQKTYDPAGASITDNYIIGDICKSIGLNPNITATPKEIKKYTTRPTLVQNLGALCFGSKNYHFVNGVLSIEDLPGAGLVKKYNTVLLNYKTGLIGTPEIYKEKGITGWKFKSLFIHSIKLNTYARLQFDENSDGTFKNDLTIRVLSGKTKFSTFDQCECEFIGVPV